jgi:hypothetical protein
MKRRDTNIKISNFLIVTGLMKQYSGHKKIHKGSRIRIYNTIALALLLHENECWTLKAELRSGITATEIKYMR